jgi:hypothetical protein
VESGLCSPSIRDFQRLGFIRLALRAWLSLPAALEQLPILSRECGSMAEVNRLGLDARLDHLADEPGLHGIRVSVNALAAGEAV